LLRGNEKQFRRGLVFKARRLFVSLNSRPRVIKKKGQELLGRVARDKAVLRPSWDLEPTLRPQGLMHIGARDPSA